MQVRSRRRMWIALLLLSVGLAACSSVEGEPSPSATLTSTTPPPETNALSGRIGPNGPVLVVKIDDTANAHPQIGLDRADVVYVEQVEAGLTRLAAVFSSELPPRIGPVRSARISDIDIFANYPKVAFAYSGAQGRLLPYIAAANWWDLGAQRQSSTIYTRDSLRRAPWNMVLLPQALLEKAAERGQVPESARSVGWEFGPLPRGGTPISSVEVRWPSSRYLIQWREGSFALTQDGREEVVDGAGAIVPSTIVIQLAAIVPSEFGDRYGGITPKTEVVGSGTALVLRDGVIFRATWKRPSLTDPTTFTRADGSTLAFDAGQVWVMLADQTRPPTIVTRGPSPVQPPLQSEQP